MSSNLAVNNSWFIGFVYLVLGCIWGCIWDLFRRRFSILCGRFYPWVLEEVGLDGLILVKAKQSKAKVTNKVEVVIPDEGMDQRALVSKVINAKEEIGPTRDDAIVSEVIKLFSS